MIRRKLAALMFGRYGSYGSDKLGFALIIVSLLLSVTARFIPNRTASLIVYAAGLLFFGLYLFRIFSKNIPKRMRENAVFCSVLRKIRLWFRLQYDRIKDIKKYRYRRCRSCKAVLRLPPKRGKHTVVCPKCGTKFNVRNIF